MRHVFDSAKLPTDCRLQVSQMLGLDMMKSYRGEDAIRESQHAMARMLAEAILKREKFFAARELPGHVGIIEVKADCIVLTAEEYSSLITQAYIDGRHDAINRVMP
jgi:hypothetical protein